MLVSVYIRKKDEDKWRKLPKKTEAISKMLNGQKLDAIKIKETIPTNSISNHTINTVEVEEIFPQSKVFNREGFEPIPKSFSARKKR